MSQKDIAAYNFRLTKNNQYLEMCETTRMPTWNRVLNLWFSLARAAARYSRIRFSAIQNIRFYWSRIDTALNWMCSLLRWVWNAVPMNALHLHYTLETIQFSFRTHVFKWSSIATQNTRFIFSQFFRISSFFTLFYMSIFDFLPFFLFLQVC